MTQRDVLIGHTGFVGSNLATTGKYSALYNSRNIDGICGGSFRVVVCAGVSAKKWLANKEPQADRAGILALTEPLKTIKADLFVLISTVDVFAQSFGADEATVPERAGLHPYGLHRLELEDFVRERFTRVVVLRLPALFGPGLRKNVLYDLLHDNMLDVINPDASFQWYPVKRLQADIDRAAAAGLSLVHLATEPLSTRAILDRCFPTKQVGAGGKAALYDLHTQHASVFRGSGPYLMRRDAVLTEIGHYVESERVA